MSWKFSGVGAEPKKLAALGVLVAVAGIAYLANRAPGDTGAPSTVSAGSRPVAAAPANDSSVSKTAAATRTQRPRGRQRGENSGFAEFRPSLKPKKDAVTGEATQDRANIDPSLRLDLLTKLRGVTLDGISRSLFEIGAATPLTAAGAAKTLTAPKIALGRPKLPIGPQPPPPPGPKVEPPAPPIPLKFYGFIAPRGSPSKRAFFLDGDDIIVATEGQVVKNRYRIVRIGVNSAVVEDTQFNNHQQTLPLIEEQPG